MRATRKSPLYFPVIGIAGKAGSGKDTLAELLTDKYHTVTYRLADPLKWALNEMFDFSSEDWADREWREKTIDWIGKSPRQLIQTLGTDWGRELVGKETWIRLADQLFKEIDTDSGWTMVVPDIRFNNEAMWVYARGGIVVKVDRPGVAEINRHTSEAGVSDAFLSGSIINSGEPQDMHDQLIRIINRSINRQRSVHG